MMVEWTTETSYKIINELLGSGVVFMWIGLLTSIIFYHDNPSRESLVDSCGQTDRWTMKTVGTFRDVVRRRLKPLCPSIILSRNIVQVSW